MQNSVLTLESANTWSSSPNSKTTRVLREKIQHETPQNQTGDNQESQELEKRAPKEELENFIDLQQKIKQKLEQISPNKISSDDQGNHTDKIKSMVSKKKKNMGLLVQGKVQGFDKNLEVFRKLDTFLDVKRSLQRINESDDIASPDLKATKQVKNTYSSQFGALSADSMPGIQKYNGSLYQKLQARRSSLTKVNNSYGDVHILSANFHKISADNEPRVLEVDSVANYTGAQDNVVYIDKFEEIRRKKYLARKQRMRILTKAERKELEKSKGDAPTMKRDTNISSNYFNSVLAHLEETTTKLPILPNKQIENNAFNFYTEVESTLQREILQKPVETQQNEKVEADEKVMSLIAKTLKKRPNPTKNGIEEQDQLINRLENYKEKSERILYLLSGATKHIYNKKFMIPSLKPRKKQDVEENKLPKISLSNVDKGDNRADKAYQKKEGTQLKYLLSPSHSVGARISTEHDSLQEESLQKSIQFTQDSFQHGEFKNKKRMKLQMPNSISAPIDDITPEKRVLTDKSEGKTSNRQTFKPHLPRDIDQLSQMVANRGLFKKFNAALIETDNLKGEFKDGLHDVNNRIDKMESYYQAQHRKLLIKSRLVPESLILAAPKIPKGLLEKRRQFNNNLTKKVLSTIF